MKKIAFLTALCVSSWAFSETETDGIKQVRTALLQKTGIFFAKGDTISKERYLEILKALEVPEKDFGIGDAIVTIGERSSFKTDLYIGPHGPEYAIDNLLAVSLDIEVDGSLNAASISKFLSELPVDEEVSKFIKTNFVGSDRYALSYGKDFCLASMMATMLRYPDHQKTLRACGLAIEKMADSRIVPFLRAYMTQVNEDPETGKMLEKLHFQLIDKTVKKEIHGRPFDCTSLPRIAKNITGGTDRREVESSLLDLSRLTCKEAVSYLFMINNISYINRGDNLFGNENYFAWDRENLRYSLDLKTKGQLEQDINGSYSRMLSGMGITFTEGLRLLAEKYERIFVGSDSLYFEYLFRIPFEPGWNLNKKELFNLVNNALYADAGYELKRSDNIYKLSKVRQ